MQQYQEGRTHSYVDQDESIRVKEKIKSTVFPDPLSGCKWVAGEIAQLIRKRSEYNKKCVIGLATGSTPVGVYKELIRMHKEENLSFKNVITFNLDEYYPIQKSAPQSYDTFMREQLFNHIDILPENANIPDGTVERSQLENFCKDYEKRITRSGGIDLQILGIGRTGHIGFNEPGSSIKSQTRVINLDKMTRIDAASDFMGIDNVPKQAITMGIQTIMSAKRIIIMAYNENKVNVVAKAVEGEITQELPASYLQQHPYCDMILDKSSASKLTRYSAPWTIKGINTDPNMDYDDYWAIKAVAWLCKIVKKPILRLVEQDYEEHGLIDLVNQVGQGDVGKVNLKLFKKIQSKVTGWPAGGKPEENKSDIQNVSYYQKSTDLKKVLIFSPHPDDDVICMGGAMEKLINQGHDIHVAYQTSGNLAVFDHDASKFNDFVREFAKLFLQEQTQINQICGNIDQILDQKKSYEFDKDEVQKIKTLVRRTEARQAAICLGVNRKNIYHLDLPFYESGKVQKKPLSEEDVTIVYNLIKQVNPQIIYAAGDLTDPHGTHRVCLQAVLKAIDRLNKEEGFLSKCEVLLYRGAWQEWELEIVDHAIPMSPEELQRKIQAIFKHQSQKDRAMFPGGDGREFWQRASDRNKDTANLFTNLGLTQYEAVECFVKLSNLKKYNIV